MRFKGVQLHFMVTKCSPNTRTLFYTECAFNGKVNTEVHCHPPTLVGIHGYTMNKKEFIFPGAQ